MGAQELPKGLEERGERVWGRRGGGRGGQRGEGSVCCCSEGKERDEGRRRRRRRSVLGELFSVDWKEEEQEEEEDERARERERRELELVLVLVVVARSPRGERRERADRSCLSLPFFAELNPTFHNFSHLLPHSSVPLISPASRHRRSASERGRKRRATPERQSPSSADSSSSSSSSSPSSSEDCSGALGAGQPRRRRWSSRPPQSVRLLQPRASRIEMNGLSRHRKRGKARRVSTSRVYETKRASGKN